jgi:rhamnogalacturonan endolyase
MKQSTRSWFLCLPLLAINGTVFASKSEVLVDDDYRAMIPGMLSPDIVGARTEYHYLPCAQPHGNWTVSTFRSDVSQRAWRLIEENGERYLWQSCTEVDRDRPFTHPMIVAGDDLWRNYTVEVKYAPQSDPNTSLGEGKAAFESGVLFRCHTSRDYYFAGVIGQRAVIKKVNDGVAFRAMDERTLAEAPFSWTPGGFISLKVTAAEDKLTAQFGNGVSLEARDAGITHGRIGFCSDMPAKFARVRVTTSLAGKRAFDKAAKDRAEEQAKLEAANPKMVLWRKISTPAYGAARNLRFGDLEGNGRMDILLVQQNTLGPADSHSEVGCMTAINLEGRILWQVGTADPWHDRLTSDVAVQIHDLEGVGTNDVVYCRNQQIIVADGVTGRTKYSAPTPASGDIEKRKDLYPRILGDAICFADFRGLGAKRDFILKDRYHNIWAYTDKLEELWHVALNTGHYPFAYRVNGRDELAVGYSLISPDGKIIWSLDNQLANDHADGVAIVQMKDGAAPRWICVASDDGFLEADLNGHILEHLEIGHQQNESIAKFRPDLPGLQIVTMNFWGNQGIVSFFDADGKKCSEFQAANYGSMLLPLNWKGDGQEYWILSANSETGGVYDGWGRRVMRFPRDGHPDMCVATLDLFGDCRDEIVVWDPMEIWIYTQSDNPKPGKLYKPTRNPLYNESNYRAGVSLPGWSE